MEYFFFFTWIFLIVIVLGKVAIAYYDLQEKLKSLDTNPEQPTN